MLRASAALSSMKNCPDGARLVRSWARNAARQRSRGSRLSSEIASGRSGIDLRRPPMSSTSSQASGSAEPVTASMTIRPSLYFATIAGVGLGCFALGVFYPPFEIAYNHPVPRHSLTSSGRGNGGAEDQARVLERKLKTLPVLESLRRDALIKGECDLWNESRLFATPSPNYSTHLISGNLMGPGKITIPPLVRVKQDGSEAVVVCHVGRELCGHDGVIHGGLIATLLDQHMARLGIQNLPARFGATANLNIDYKAPTYADQFLVLRISIDQPGPASARKALVKGRVEDLSGQLLAEARATIVQPRNVEQFLKKSEK